MLNIKEGQFGTVFQVQKEDKYVDANLSTSKKKQDGSYENSSWKARFVGKALEGAKELTDKDCIRIISGGVEVKKSEKNGQYYTSVIIFEFEKVDK